MRVRASQRRRQLTDAAARRFCEVGYHHVSLADVAADVGVTGPAVYRHFRSKQALLAGAITSGLDLLESTVRAGADRPLDEVVDAMANACVQRPDLWVLLQREARFLDPDHRAAVEEQVARIADGLVGHVRRERPALGPQDARMLGTAASAVLSTPAPRRDGLAPAVRRRAVTAAAMAVLRLDPTILPAVEPPPAGPTGDGAPRSRRREVVDRAIDLFFARGYGAVSLDDIGAAVGIAGPSLYHHFATKADILVAAFDRASDELASSHAHFEAAEPRPTLTELVGWYTGFCLGNRSLVGVYASETADLPPRARQRTTAVVRDNVADWVAALRTDEPHLDPRVARVRVLCALTAVNELVRLGHLHERPRFAGEIRAVVMAVLRSR